MLEDIRKMEEPKTMGECWKVFKEFGLVLPSNLDYTFENAIQLVKVNNELLSRIDKYKWTLETAQIALKDYKRKEALTLISDCLEKE